MTFIIHYFNRAVTSWLGSLAGWSQRETGLLPEEVSPHAESTAAFSWDLLTPDGEQLSSYGPEPEGDRRRPYFFTSRPVARTAYTSALSYAVCFCICQCTDCLTEETTWTSLKSMFVFQKANLLFFIITKFRRLNRRWMISTLAEAQSKGQKALQNFSGCSCQLRAGSDGSKRRLCFS